MTQTSPSPGLTDEDPREALARAIDPIAFASWAEHYAMAARHGDPEKSCRSFAEWGSSGACTRAREAANQMIADPLSLSKAVLRAGAAEARATAAEAALLQKDGEIARLLRFVDYLRMWRDRGPPHGDPVTAWSVVAHHPIVTARDRALAPTEPLPARDDEASR